LFARALTIAVLATLLVACGGEVEREISLAEWADRYDALCVEANQEIRALEAEVGGAPSVDELAEFVSTAVELAREYTRDLRELPPPSTDQLMALSAEGVELLEGWAEVLRSGDQALLERLIARLDALSVEATMLEREIGADECAALSDLLRGSPV
jgi:hypothetical protein